MRDAQLAWLYQELQENLKPVEVTALPFTKYVGYHTVIDCGLGQVLGAYTRLFPMKWDIFKNYLQTSDTRNLLSFLTGLIFSDSDLVV